MGIYFHRYFTLHRNSCHSLCFLLFHFLGAFFFKEFSFCSKNSYSFVSIFSHIYVPNNPLPNTKNIFFLLLTKNGINKEQFFCSPASASASLSSSSAFFVLKLYIIIKCALKKTASEKSISSYTHFLLYFLLMVQVFPLLPLLFTLIKLN